MKRESTPSPKSGKKRKEPSFSPYSKKLRKKDMLIDSNPLKSNEPILNFTSHTDTKQRLFTGAKIQSEISRLKAFQTGPVRPKTEGKRLLKMENDSKKQKLAKQRPASPGFLKACSKILFKCIVIEETYGIYNNLVKATTSTKQKYRVRNPVKETKKLI